MRLSVFALTVSALFAFRPMLDASPANAKTPSPSAPRSSYYPHWVSRDGTVSDNILRHLAPLTIIAVHHRWPLSMLRHILDAPGRFKIAWYVEANVQERNDPAPRGMPVAARIAEAKRKQTVLAAEYGADRFVNLVELDGARDKYEGQLHGVGNHADDWVRDAAAAKSAGFRYIAKSPTYAHVKALRAKFGADFVPRMVFEDVTGSHRDANPGYRKDARALAADGETVTLIVHQGAYGGFPATPLKKARAVIKADFSQPNVEAYWGRQTASADVVKLKTFAADSSVPAEVPKPAAKPAPTREPEKDGTPSE